MISNKVTEAIRKGSFQRADQSTHEPAEPSRADALGLTPPPLSEVQKQGLAVAAELAAGKFQARAELQERYERERDEYIASREAALMARVTARRNVKIQ